MVTVDFAQRAYARTDEDRPRQSTPVPDDGLPLRRVIRQDEVLKLTGLANRAQLHALEKHNNFPKRFSLNPAASWRFSQKGWFLDEVMGWIEARGASRDSA